MGKIIALEATLWIITWVCTSIFLANKWEKAAYNSQDWEEDWEHNKKLLWCWVLSFLFTPVVLLVGLFRQFVWEDWR